MLALALLGPSATALADGRDVLADVKDNDRIDGCYSRQELNEALDLARGYDQLYGVAVDLIREARITNVARADGSCGGPVAAGAAVADESGGSLGIWIGLAAVVGGVAVAAGAWAGRAGGGR